MKLAVVGVTGIVGQTMLRVLEERNFEHTKFIAVASEDSVGKEVVFFQKKHKIISVNNLINHELDLAFFSAGREISKEWAPKLAKKGCKIIDNSSYWRMNPNHRLIVPEINAREITKQDLIIANPNCSTIQLLMVLAPLHRLFSVKRVVVSTYQSVTGTGKKAVQQLENEEKNILGEQAYPHQIYNNVLPHCDDFEDNGYTKEEMKLANETKKILDNMISVTATAVRVPVVGGHSEAVNITFEKEADLIKIKDVFQKTPGIKVIDDTQKLKYPMPIYSHNRDEVFVGRIRKDFSQEKSINLWIVADNLRKGAATNSVQIAEYLIKNKFIANHDN